MYSEQDGKVKTIRMDEKLIEQIEKMAKDSERNFSSQVKYMLKKYIEMQEK